MDQTSTATRKRIAIYTAITAGYDNLEELTYKSTEGNIDYLAFTDCDIHSQFWKIIPLDEKYAHLDSVRKSRKPKIVGHPVLENYDYTIWIDGNIDIIGDVNELIGLLDEHDLVTFKHPSRNCVYEEAMACLSRKKDSTEVIKEHVEFLKRQGYPEKNGLNECNVLLRKKTVALEQAMNAWWEIVLNRSRRDQLSFNYIALKYNLKFTVMGDDNAHGKSKYFSLREKHLRHPPAEHYSCHYRYSTYLMTFYIRKAYRKIIRNLTGLTYLRPDGAQSK
ncbi:glycosyltransferase domain-containing protein [Azotobacter beijerinckii]|uniref:TOD1/MUCI70 glycosyltransferase-like domain-containing protein n=1 Tax=Azotobacter beijerinckii TaxID=170623 RepID=A0A1I4BM07_9GAMM|nr:glycosyltransferase domain-containing protein [Azotobacter beijerinckii]SFB10776.1 Protein of unknown function [Azotobacter beijerinckii]SFK69410.1 Protein of unknown function [Azotobacter beijerinckii]